MTAPRLPATPAHVVDLSKTADGNHRPALDAMLKDVLGDDYGKPTSEWRVAKKRVVLPAGPLVVPPGGYHDLRSIVHLYVDGEGASFHEANLIAEHASYPGSTVIGVGPMDSVLSLDGCMFGHLKDVAIVGHASSPAATACPKDLLVASHSQPQAVGPPQHDFYIRAALAGHWQDCAVRLGSPNWHTAQEDHFAFDLRILGGYDLFSANAGDPMQAVHSMKWRRGLKCGNDAPSNNRRHRGFVAARGTVRGVEVSRTDLTLRDSYIDGCSIAVSLNGGSVTFDGGEMESVGRFLVDEQGWPMDWRATFRDCYIKQDGWRPGARWQEASTNIHLADLDAASFASGKLVLDNVRFSHLPVRRHTNGKLYYVKNPRLNAAQQEVWEWTQIPAPRIRIGNAHVTTQNVSSWGYRASTGRNEFFRVVEGGFARHQGWSDVGVDGRVEKHHAADILQYAESA